MSGGENKNDKTHLHQRTQVVRSGLECDETGAVVPPMHLSSTFAFHGFGQKRTYDYTRSGNPTRDLLACALAELEEGFGAVVTSTGMSAITLVGYLIPAGSREILHCAAPSGSVQDDRETADRVLAGADHRRDAF